MLSAIAAPTLIVQGGADEYGTLAQVAAIRAGLVGPVEVVVIERAGHAPFRDAPAQVHARIAAFVRAQIS